MSLNGKVALVTGSSSGIGAAIAIRFAEEGARVAIVGRNHDKLKNVAKQCRNPLVLAADITKDEDARRIVNDTIKHFGKLDILVNNAGIIATATILDDNAMEVFDKIMLLNLRSTVYITNLAAPYLVKTKGNIVNISSMGALITNINGNSSYSASKAAMDHFSRCVAQELASKGVRVNIVNPGPVKTDIIENTGISKEDEEAFFQEMVNMTALGRVSDPVEIADIALFLASDKAKAITGSNFVSDNGMQLKIKEITLQK